MDLVKLSRDSQSLLERLADRFPPDQLRMCRESGKGGEWNEMVDIMCAVLVKRNVPVTQDERDALADLLAMYPVPVEGYDYINKRDEILATLTVTPGTD
ncbi:hypothetical protein [Saccharopolyspora pogona]|uniref:hypothetical protein n=1 Tax=Saccharopolyspora pogona TaxID=333966 RepID=UPI0016850355|nr:hypothetical protein [Saccharopolyspora pogona]